MRPGDYITKIPFYVNSKPETITIKIKAVPIELILEDYNERFVNFGGVLAGKTVSKTVKVVNRSLTTVNVVFNLYDRLPYFSKPKRVVEAEFERPPPKPKPK